MSLITTLAAGVGSAAGNAAGGVIDAFGNALDKLFTSDDERLSRQEALERLRQQPHLAQIELNKVEAAHGSIFVAGWRPAIGWVGALALAWTFIGYDLAVWLSSVAHLPAPPKLTGSENLFELVLAMLGMGGLRSFEKFKGVAR